MIVSILTLVSDYCFIVIVLEIYFVFATVQFSLIMFRIVVLKHLYDTMIYTTSWTYENRGDGKQTSETETAPPLLLMNSATGREQSENFRSDSALWLRSPGRLGNPDCLSFSEQDLIGLLLMYFLVHEELPDE